MLAFVLLVVTDQQFWTKLVVNVLFTLAAIWFLRTGLHHTRLKPRKGGNAWRYVIAILLGITAAVGWYSLFNPLWWWP